MMSQKSMVLSELNFINCLGTYIMSICNHYLKSDAILKYLSSCTVECVNLSLEQVKMEYNNNPWGYQILKLRDAKNEELFNHSSFPLFLQYIDDMFGIKVTIVNNCNGNININFLNEMKDENEIIVEVDEFYNKHNIKHYQKKHNPHAIMIKNIYKEEDIASVFDTEFSDTYTVSLDELCSAYNSKTYDSKLYIFDCKNAHLVPEFINSCKNETKVLIMPFIKFFEIVEKTDIIHADSEFVFRGYLFSILYKIMPYFQMLLKTDCFSQRKDSEVFYEKCRRINYDIKRLSMIMLKNIYKEKYSFDSIREFVTGIKVLLTDFMTLSV